MGPAVSDAQLAGTDFTDAYLYSAKFNDSNLSEAQFTRANLTFAVLNSANLRNSGFGEANLSEARFSKANLLGARLNSAKLGHISFEYSILDSLDFTDANLTSAWLRHANLTNANLTNADLTRADLAYANLAQANLNHANLAGAHLGFTVFADTHLVAARNLESCDHYGPSFLDYQTLLRSGRLPLPFLRGCGLSDEYIDYLPSLFGRAIEYNSCFISHSSHDKEFATRIHDDLQNKGVRCWCAPYDMQGGKKIKDQIDEAIQGHDRSLVILSDASMNSEWVKTEIRTALRKERERKRRVLFPISLVKYSKILEWKCFDSDTGEDLARAIREYFIPDFSNWKYYDSYQKAFDRLLRDLKAEDGQPTK